ncbi:hypothetical protein H5410_004076 [Solanum commersonii]|uniref:Uncharacterized protein n=1 Tax=Solanum commersonii TaxID=4109 RepID=A0A9J6B7F5_SOLCO|nr:hypothetical protein H5410_004076 [Solanum commersonii]
MPGHTKGRVKDGWVKEIPHSKVISTATSDSNLTDTHLLPIGDVQNSRSLILSRLRARLTKEEQEVILRLLDSSMEQSKQSSKKSTEAEVIPN